jgi:hypothetical protein
MLICNAVPWSVRTNPATAASTCATAAAPKRVRCTLAAEAPSGGVATALPTSSRRDCTSASCAHERRAREARTRGA